MGKCSWCLDEIKDKEERSYIFRDEVISHGNNSFCSNSCMNSFYREYPNEKLKDNQAEGCANFFIFLFKLCFYLFIIFLLFQVACIALKI